MSSSAATAGGMLRRMLAASSGDMAASAREADVPPFEDDGVCAGDDWLAGTTGETSGAPTDACVRVGDDAAVCECAGDDTGDRTCVGEAVVRAAQCASSAAVARAMGPGRCVGASGASASSAVGSSRAGLGMCMRTDGGRHCMSSDPRNGLPVALLAASRAFRAFSAIALCSNSIARTSASSSRLAPAPGLPPSLRPRGASPAAAKLPAIATPSGPWPRPRVPSPSVPGVPTAGGGMNAQGKP